MKFNFEQEKMSTEIVDYEKARQIINKTKTVSEYENRNWSIKDLEKQLLVALRSSGEEALRTDDRVIHTTLSGGLDSSLALAMLRKNFPEAKITTFTMGGDENHPDVKYAREASEKFNTEHIEIIPTPNEIQEALAEYQEKFPKSNVKDATTGGDFDVYLLYKNIARFNPKSLIVHDGIDEQMGGYWPHRKENTLAEKKKIFNENWEKLIQRHLDPLEKTSQDFNIRLIFPYLDEKLVKLISEIPIQDRVVDGVGKKPLRDLARQYEISEEIIDRPKRGQCGALDIEELSNKK